MTVLFPVKQSVLGRSGRGTMFLLLLCCAATSALHPGGEAGGLDDRQKNIMSQLLGDHDEVRVMSSGSDCVCRCIVRPIKRFDCRHLRDNDTMPRDFYTVETVTTGTDCQRCECLAPPSAVNPCEGEYRFLKLQEVGRDVKLSSILDLLDSMYGLNLLKLQSITTKLLDRMDNMETVTQKLAERQKADDGAKQRERERRSQQRQDKKRTNLLEHVAAKQKVKQHMGVQPKKNQQENIPEQHQPLTNNTGRNVQNKADAKQPKNRTSKSTQGLTFYMAEGVRDGKAELFLTDQKLPALLPTAGGPITTPKTPTKPATQTPKTQKTPTKPTTQTPKTQKSPTKPATQTPKTPTKPATQTPKTPTKPATQTPKTQKTPTKPATQTPKTPKTPTKPTTQTPKTQKTPTKATTQTPKTQKTPTKPTTQTPKRRLTPLSSIASTTFQPCPTSPRPTPELQRAPMKHVFTSPATTAPSQSSEPAPALPPSSGTTTATMAAGKSRLSWTENSADKHKPTKKPGVCKDTIMVISEPVEQNSYGLSDGAWMKDPRGHGNVIYLTNGRYGNSLLEFRDLDAFRSGQPSNSYQLPYSFRGSGHAVYGGALFYSPAFSRDIVRYHLWSRSVWAWTTLQDAVLEGQGGDPHTKVQFLVDESGLWLLYPAVDSEGFHQEVITLSRLRPRDLQPIQSFRTGLRRGRYGDSFLVCGVLYAVDGVDRRHANVTYAFDTHTLTHTAPALTLSLRYAHAAQLSYCPLDRRLYAWDQGHQLTYDLVFAY